MQRSGGSASCCWWTTPSGWTTRPLLLFQQLVSARTVFAVAGVRTGEPAPDAVQAVWKNGLCDRVEVGPLEQGRDQGPARAGVGGPGRGRGPPAAVGRQRGQPAVPAGAGAGRRRRRHPRGRRRPVADRRRISPSERLQDLVGERLAGARRRRGGHPRAGRLRRALGRRRAGRPRAGPMPWCGSSARDWWRRQWTGAASRPAWPIPSTVRSCRERTPLTRARQVQRQLADAVESHDNRRRIDVLKVALWRVRGRRVHLARTADRGGPPGRLRPRSADGAALGQCSPRHRGDVRGQARSSPTRSTPSDAPTRPRSVPGRHWRDEAADDGERATLVRVRVLQPVLARR